MERLQDFLVDRLCDLFCQEVAGFCVWRVCVIFVCGEVEWFFSLPRVAWFIFMEVAWFVLWRGCKIFLLRDCMKRLCDFFLWRGCMIFWVKRFFSEKKKLSYKIFFWWKKAFLVTTVTTVPTVTTVTLSEEVAWFFVWRGFLWRKKVFW